MIADVVGYSRLMSVAEESTHLRLSDYIKNSIEPKISEHGGRLIRSAGDGPLVEFDSAVEAVYCALEIQHELAARDAITVAALPLRRDYALLSPRASIMVLPFRNVSSIPGQDYFADAVTDDVTTDLSRLSDTVVISPGTAFTYKGKAVDPRQIGREFGVRYLLEGSIRKDGMQVQTNAQLVDARSAAHIWADRFDTELADLSELQDAITGRIASSLHIQAEHRRAMAERPADPDAVDLRLHAMALIVAGPSPEHHLSARQFLEESLQRDPQSAESWSQLAGLLVNDYLNDWNEAKQSAEARKDLLRRAEKALAEALKIDPIVPRRILQTDSSAVQKGTIKGRSTPSTGRSSSIPIRRVPTRKKPINW